MAAQADKDTTWYREETMAIYKSGRKAPEETNPACHTLISNLHSLQISGEKNVYVSHSVCGTLS